MPRLSRIRQSRDIKALILPVNMNSSPIPVKLFLSFFIIVSWYFAIEYVGLLQINPISFCSLVLHSKPPHIQ